MFTAPESGTDSKTILVVDDDLSVLGVIKVMLESGSMMSRSAFRQILFTMKAAA